MSKKLESAAEEWKPDQNTLVEDPYGFANLDVSDAQASDEPLPLDLELPTEEETEAALAGVSQAIEEQVATDEAQLQSWVGESPEQAAERLAAQIAEDEALSAVLAQEATEDDEEVAAALPQDPLDATEIQSCIETLLFLSDKPVKLEKLREMIGPDFKFGLFQEAMTELSARYQKPEHGIELVEVGGGYQFRTKPAKAALARKLSKIQTQRLSSGAMETLAIVAYRQPVMKEEVDKIRGVDSSHFIRGLLEKHLIGIDGRSELPGRPMLYTTTPEFLQIFGLKDLQAMPSLRELEAMIPASSSAGAEEEDPRIKEMRKLVADMKANAQSILNYDPREDDRILKDIREKIQQIPTSTPTLDAQALAESQAAELAKNPPIPVELAVGITPELPIQPVLPEPSPEIGAESSGQ